MKHHKNLVTLALGGTCALLVLRAQESFPLGPRQDQLWLVLVGIAAGSFLLWRILPTARTRLRWRLLIPVGVFVTLSSLSGWYAEQPIALPLTEVVLQLELALFPVRITFMLLVGWALYAFYVAWLTPMVVRAASDDQDATPSELEGFGRRMWKAAVLLAFGWLGLVALLIPLLLLITGLSGPIVLFCAVGALIVIAWNTLFAPLLLVGLTERGSLIRHIGRAFRLGRQHWKRLVVPVLMQSLLLGAFTYVNVTFDHQPPEKYVLHTTERGPWTQVQFESAGFSFSTIKRWNTQVNAASTVGFAADSQWDDSLAATLDTSPVPLLELLSWLLLSAVAILVKLHVWQVVAARRDEAPAAHAPTSVAGLLIGALLLLPACSDPDHGLRVDEVADRAFLEADAGRFHVRMPDGYGMQALAKTLAGTNGHVGLPKDFPTDLQLDPHAGWDTQCFEYVPGSNGRLEIWARDGRVPESSGEVAERSPRRSGDLLRLQCEVRQRERVFVFVGRRGGQERRDKSALAFVIVGAQNLQAAGATDADVQTYESPAGRRVWRVSRVVSGPAALPTGGKSFAMPTPFTFYYGHLGGDYDWAFPIVTWLEVRPFSLGSARSGRGSSSAGPSIHHESERLKIQGDGVEYRVELDGKVVDDLSTWPAPIWVVRGRFVANEE